MEIGEAGSLIHSQRSVLRCKEHKSRLQEWFRIHHRFRHFFASSIWKCSLEWWVLPRWWISIQKNGFLMAWHGWTWWWYVFFLPCEMIPTVKILLPHSNYYLEPWNEKKHAFGRMTASCLVQGAQKEYPSRGLVGIENLQTCIKLFAFLHAVSLFCKSWL